METSTLESDFLILLLELVLSRDRGPLGKAQPSWKEEGFVSHFLNDYRRRRSRQIIFPKVLLLWCLHVTKTTKWKRSHRVFFTQFCPDWKTSSSWIIAHTVRASFLRLTLVPILKSKLKSSIFRWIDFEFSHCLKITQNVAFEFLTFWHFPPIFVLFKTELSGNSVWPQALGFQKLAKMDHFWHF